MLAFREKRIDRASKCIEFGQSSIYESQSSFWPPAGMMTMMVVVIVKQARKTLVPDGTYVNATPV